MPPRALSLVVALAGLVGCQQPPPSAPQGPPRVILADVAVDIQESPFAISIVPLQNGSFGTVLPIVKSGTPALAFATVPKPDPSTLYDPTLGAKVTWVKATRVVGSAPTATDGARLAVATEDPKHRFLVTLDPGTVPDTIDVTVSVDPPDTQVVDTRLALAAPAGEQYYGLGEWFDGFTQRGKVRDLRFDVNTTDDAGTNQMHVHAPAYVSTAGYGVLLDDAGPVVADMAATGPDVTLTVVGNAIHAHLMAATDPVTAAALVQAQAGLPPMPPEWTFGPMQWRDEDPVTCTTACSAGCDPSSTGQDVVLADAQQMRTLGLPGSAIWIDAPWETGFNTFAFNPVQFPDPKGMIAKLHALGYKVVVWASPFMDAADDSATECGMNGTDAAALYAEAKQKGYLVTGSSGEPLTFPWRGTTGALVDFTSPDATAWWEGLAEGAVRDGVDGFKLDFDEYILPAIAGIAVPDYYHFASGATGVEMSSRYHALFHHAAAEALRAVNGTGGFVIGRTGSISDAVDTTAVWPGDLCNGFQTHGSPVAGSTKTHAGGLPAALSAMVSLAASAHPYFGSDIGGYRHGAPTSEALARWIELGALSPVMELGGGGTDHNPWDASLYDPSLVPLYRTYAELHTDLFPYLETLAEELSTTGRPLVRAPGMEYPGDADLRDVDDAYFLGPYLMVAPVLTAGATTRDVVFPGGRWVSWWDDSVVTGPTTATVPAPLDQIPLYVPEGAVIPMLPTDVDTLAPATDRSVVSADDRAGQLTVRIYPEAASSQVDLVDGTRITADGSGTGLVVTVAAASLARTYTLRIEWKLLSSVVPARVASDAKGDLTEAPDQATFAAAASGWYYDAGAGVLWVRLPIDTTGDLVQVQ